MSISQSPKLRPLPLPPGLSERYITHDASELTFHIIEAGSVTQPMILLVHGFPEIAYSWRKIMPSLASAGYYVVAVDQRGYGRTTGWDTGDFEHVDLRNFSPINLFRDMVILVHALAHRRVHCIIGHDFGAVTASMCALARPDFFERLVLMSHPFKGAPPLPYQEKSEIGNAPGSDIHKDLAQLPEPRKHYKWYYSTAEANSDLARPDGLHEFFRGYYYLKSADWTGNHPQALQAWSATELAKMPFYYVMPLDANMPKAVEQQLDDDVGRSTKWLPDEELNVYVEEYLRTGFQGGLNWYRVFTDPSKQRELDMFAGGKIETPCIFISGTKDWGPYQEPGVVENMSQVCTDFRGVRLIENAGHWVQQEQPEAVLKEILAFLA